MNNIHHLMRDWMHEVDAGRLSETDAIGRVARFIQTQLACTRVNFWSLHGAPGGRSMRRVIGYDSASDRVLTEPIELQETNGAFFDALLRDGCYMCADTAADANLALIFPTYLKPTNAGAMLVAAFGINGRTLGFIACVHSSPRKWLPAEITAVRKCAAEVSIHRARRRPLSDLEAHGDGLEP